MDGEHQELFVRAQEIAHGMLIGKIDLVSGGEQLQQLYIDLEFPEELKHWMYLADGHSDEYYDKTWIPGVTKYNYENWVATVRAKAKELVGGNG